MLSPQNLETASSLLLLFFAYLFSITLSGNFQAYVAKKCGDDTADRLGFTEFNPFLFINFLDIAWFVFFRIMIGRPVPLELTSGIKRHHRWWRTRLFVMFSSRSFFHFMIAVLATITSVFLCKTIVFDFDALSSVELLKANLSSISYLLCKFCGALIWTNIFLATFECCRQIIHFFILYKLEKDFTFIEYADYVLIFGPLLVWIFFGQTILHAFIYGVDCVILGISAACRIPL